MVQGDQFSELSRFLLGNNLGRTGKQGAAAAAAAMAAGAALPMLLPGSCGPSPGLLEPLAQAKSARERGWGGEEGEGGKGRKGGVSGCRCGRVAPGCMPRNTWMVDP